MMLWAICRCVKGGGAHRCPGSRGLSSLAVLAGAIFAALGADSGAVGRAPAVLIPGASR